MNNQLLNNKVDERYNTITGDILVRNIKYKFHLGINKNDYPRAFFTGAIYRPALGYAPVDGQYAEIPNTSKKVSWDIEKYKIPVIPGLNEKDRYNVAVQILRIIKDEMPDDTVALFQKHYYGENNPSTPIKMHMDKTPEVEFTPPKAQTEVIKTAGKKESSLNINDIYTNLKPLIAKDFVSKQEVVKLVKDIIGKNDSISKEAKDEVIIEFTNKLNEPVINEKPAQKTHSAIKPVIPSSKIEEKKLNVTKEEKANKRPDLHPSLQGKHVLHYTRKDVTLLPMTSLTKNKDRISKYMTVSFDKATRIELENAFFAFLEEERLKIKSKSSTSVNKKAEETSKAPEVKIVEAVKPKQESLTFNVEDPVIEEFGGFEMIDSMYNDAFKELENEDVVQETLSNSNINSEIAALFGKRA